MGERRGRLDDGLGRCRPDVLVVSSDTGEMTPVGHAPRPCDGEAPWACAPPPRRLWRVIVLYAHAQTRMRPNGRRLT
jgi:hypothetical protein